MRTMKAEEFLINNAMICQFADGGGNDMVTLDDAKQAIDMAHNEAVKKWSLWCFNYHTPFERVICQIWGGTLAGFGGRYYCEDNFENQHLIEKWQSFENRGDARMLFFYCELDKTHRSQLVDWVMKNYEG